MKERQDKLDPRMDAGSWRLWNASSATLAVWEAVEVMSSAVGEEGNKVRVEKELGA